MREKLMTTKGMKEWLGASHEALKAWRDRAADPLPAMKLGKKWIYDPVAVLRWAERNGKRAIAPKARRAAR